MNNHLPKILVVDDKAQNRALIAEYLEPLNVDIDEAASGEECLRLLKKNNYTLVLLDIQMPGLDGFQVLERMRGDEDLKEIPVVFISAIFNTEEYILKGIEKGAIDFITKPVNVDILQSKVNNFLKLYEKQIALDNLVKVLGVTNKRLENSEKRFKRITQSANDAIIVLDKDFRVRFWNKAAVRIFGYSRFEMLYENFAERSVSPACREKFQSLTGNMLDSTKSNPGDAIQITGLKKDGEEFPVEMSLSYFIDTDKQVNFTLVIRDITQRLLMEKEALKARELQETNRVMKEFMDSVSHELRTPMNAILGISNMLLKYNSDNLLTDQREGLEIINQSGTRLLDMINDILDLSRLEENKATLNNEYIEIESVLSPLYGMMYSLIGEKKIRFHIFKSSSISGSIYTDQKKLNQVLTNLLGNAAKFTNEGKINLYIHQIQDKLYFEVSDTGIGIPEEHLEDIFEKFRQIDSSTTKEYQGTGLGLNICKKLVELMGGEIKALSTLGEGTTITFYLPNQPHHEQKSKSSGTVKKRTGITYSVKGDIVKSKLVGIISGNEEMNFWYSKVFEKLSFNSITCLSQREALGVVVRFAPDIILLKMEMAGTHGASILKAVEKLQYYSQIPVIAITNDTDFSIQHITNPVILLQEPVDEKMVKDSVMKLVKNEVSKIPANNIILYEKENHLKAYLDSSDECYCNDDFTIGTLLLSRRSVQTLLLDDIDISGENLKLLKWLKEHQENLPEKLVVITANLFNYITDELRDIKNSYVVTYNSIKEYNSIDGILIGLK